MKRKWKAFTAMVLAMMLLFGNAMTILAADQSASDIVTSDFVSADGGVYDVDAVAPVANFQNVLYGNSLMSATVTAAVIHNYVTGYYRVHTLHADGSCNYKIYNAQICTICGLVLVGSLVSVTDYTVCPH